jgi:hypothetical protein
VNLGPLPGQAAALPGAQAAAPPLPALAARANGAAESLPITAALAPLLPFALGATTLSRGVQGQPF